MVAFLLTIELACATLKTFIQEWGSEFITVKLPASLCGYGRSSLGTVRLEFSEIDQLAICVKAEDGEDLLVKRFEMPFICAKER